MDCGCACSPKMLSQIKYLHSLSHSKYTSTKLKTFCILYIRLTRLDQTRQESFPTFFTLLLYLYAYFYTFASFMPTVIVIVVIVIPNTFSILNFHPFEHRPTVCRSIYAPRDDTIQPSIEIDNTVESQYNDDSFHFFYNCHVTILLLDTHTHSAHHSQNDTLISQWRWYTIFDIAQSKYAVVAKKSVYAFI